MSIIDNMSREELQALLKEGKKKLQATSKPRKASKLPKTITDTQITQLLTSLKLDTNTGKKNNAIILTMLRCGLRASEICNLTPADLDFEKHTLYIQLSKGQKDRYVPMTSEVEQAISTWQEVAPPSNYVFPTCSGRQMLPRAVTSMVNNMSRIAGVYVQDGRKRKLVHPHILRHTYATNMLEQGINIREVQEMLGHASIATTQKYTHIDINALTNKVRSLSK